MSKNSPKTTKDTWERVRLEFESGNFKTLKEISDKYSINPVTLRTHMYREKWNLKQSTLQNKVERKIEEVKVSQVELYLKKSIKRNERYEELIDASIGQLAVNQEGKPLVEPSDIGEYTKAEQRIQAMTFAALRIPVASSVDVTSGGKTLEQSMVSAIEKLRESGKTIDLTREQLDIIKDAEIVD